MSEYTDLTKGELEVKHATLGLVKMKLQRVERLLDRPTPLVDPQVVFAEVVSLQQQLDREMNVVAASLKRLDVPEEGEG